MRYGYYEYEYIESNGFMSTAYAIIVTLNSVKVSQGGVTKEYQFKHENGVLSLIGDGKTLCEIEMNGIKAITNVSVDSATRQLVFDIEMMDGTKEKATLDLSELIQLYNAKDGLHINDDGEISIVIHDDESILKEDENGLYIDLVGGNGIEISGNVVSYVGSGDTRYTNDEIDDMVNDLESYISENASGITENYELIGVISGDVITISENVDTLVDELSGLTDALIEVSGKCDTNSENITSNLLLINDLSGITLETINKVDELDDRISGNTTSIADLTHHVDDLEEKINTIEGNLNDYIDSNDDAVRVIENNLNSITGELNEKCESIESTLNDTITLITSDYSTKAYVDEKENGLKNYIETTSGECTTYTDGAILEFGNEIDNIYAKKTDLSSYATANALLTVKDTLNNDIIETKNTIESGITDTLTAYAKKSELEPFAKEEELEQYAKKTDLNGLSTEEYVNVKLADYALSSVIEAMNETVHGIEEKVTGIEGNYVKSNELDSSITAKLEGYDKSLDVDAKIMASENKISGEIETSISASEAKTKTEYEDYIETQMNSLSVRLENIERRLTDLENK